MPNDPHQPRPTGRREFLSQLSAAAAGFGMLLRDSKFKGDLTFDRVMELAKGAKGQDEEGYRAEFLRLVETSKLLDPPKQ